MKKIILLISVMLLLVPTVFAEFSYNANLNNSACAKYDCDDLSWTHLGDTYTRVNNISIGNFEQPSGKNYDMVFGGGSSNIVDNTFKLISMDEFRRDGASLSGIGVEDWIWIIEVNCTTTPQVWIYVREAGIPLYSINILNTCVDINYVNASATTDTGININPNEVHLFEIIYNETTEKFKTWMDGGAIHDWTGSKNINNPDFWAVYVWDVARESDFDNWIVSNLSKIQLSSPPENLLDLKIVNENKNVFPSISEDDNFFIFSNYTNEGIPITTANCNFTAINISSHFSSNGTDFLLENSDSQLSLIIDESNDNLLFDFYEFSICRDTSKTSVQVILNDFEFNEINQNLIPLCSLGNHTEQLNLTDYNNVTLINFTVKCDECNGGNKQITILSNTDNNLLHYERVFSEHSENLTYNVTSTLYEFTEHLYHFNYFNVLNGNITLICDDEISSSLTPIAQVNLSIDIISINDIEFTSGINIESSETTEILIDVSGDFIVSLQFNVTYENGTLVKSISEEFMNLTFEDLNIDGIYNISIFAIDDDNTIVTLKDFFVINDTTVPTILWVVPLEDNSSIFTVNESVSFNIIGNDLNLFGYNITFKYPNNTIHSSFQKLNLVVQSEAFLKDIIFLIEGIWIVNATFVDKHTTTIINDYSITKTDDSLTFDSIKIKCLNAIKTSYIKLDDRYTFDCEFMKSHSIRKVVILESNNFLYPIKDSEYTAHFVDWNNKKWIDFEGKNKNPKIIKINNTAYAIEFTTLESIIGFSSIGDLNIVTETAEFKIIPKPFVPISLLNFDLTKQTNVLILFILIFLYLGVMYLGFQFSNFAFSSMGFMVGIVIGFLLASLSGWLMLVMVMLNVLVFYNIAKRR